MTYCICSVSELFATSLAFVIKFLGVVGLNVLLKTKFKMIKMRKTKSKKHTYFKIVALSESLVAVRANVIAFLLVNRLDMLFDAGDQDALAADLAVGVGIADNLFVMDNSDMATQVGLGGKLLLTLKKYVRFNSISE